MGCPGTPRPVAAGGPDAESFRGRAGLTQIQLSTLQMCMVSSRPWIWIDYKIEDNITDISKNKKIIQNLQSVDYSILLANAPAQWPTPVIQESYNAVVVNSDGVNIITQNFGPSSKINSLILQITSEDTNDETIKIITKGLYFKNAIDNSIQLIVNNDGLFIKDLSSNIISLQDWMDALTRIIKILGGIDGDGYDLSDLISDVVGGVVTVEGFLSSVGFFTFVATIMKSTFIKTSVVSSITSGLDMGNDFKNKFVNKAILQLLKQMLKMLLKMYQMTNYCDFYGIITTSGPK